MAPGERGAGDMRAAASRWAGLFLFWIVLGRVGVADLLAGAVTCALAAAASLVLVPATAGRARPLAMLRFAGRFALRSLLAGMDVARLAFDPRLPLRPGLLIVRTHCPEGLSRQAFRAIMSLQPGSLPVAQTADTLVLHCLDAAGPVARDFGADEELFLACGGGAAHV